MKSGILLLLLFILSNTIFAQDSSLLKNYKYRTPGYRALLLNISLGGAASVGQNSNISQKNLSANLSPSYINYYRIISTETRLHTSTIQFQPYFSLYRSGDKLNTTKSNEFQEVFRWERNDKFYKNDNKFLELGNKLFNTLRINKYDDKLYYEKGNDLEIENTVILGIGKGRIEAVQDVQMALFILNDLQEHGLIGPVDYETQHEFAKLITEINNTRVFDSRRRRIFELTKIDSFLKAKGLTENTDIRHFTTINDNWSLAFNPLRFSGSNIYLRLMPSAGLKQRKIKSKSNTNDRNLRFNDRFLSVSPQLGFEKYVPVSLKWQKDMGANISLSKEWTLINNREEINNNIQEITSNYSLSQIAFNAFYGYGYYPNNRTLINANFNLSAYYDNYDNSSIEKIISVRPYLYLNANYFVGYRTRISGDFYLDYTKATINYTNSFENRTSLLRTHFTLGITHFIF